jgi:hypothetical protein
MKFSFFLLSFICLSTGSVAQNISLETKSGKSGTTYTFFNKNACKIAFTNVRPDKKDASVLMCIPAAFTNTGNDHIDGIFAVKGKVENTGVINKTLGGVCYIEKNTCRIFQSGKGRLFKDSLYQVVKNTKASFFQQIQCIENGRAASFADQKIFQRRGIAVLKDYSIAIIESKENISLKVFSEDLVELGVIDLIYTDMGTWDEGWYRDPATKTTKTIGRYLSQTARQSNWVVFQK